MAIKNIIFDLGGVLLDIDFNKTREVFIGYGVNHFDAYYQQSFSSRLFANLEKGLISPGEFYDGFRSLSKTDIVNEHIEKAWNALLIGFRKESVAFVRSLKQQYNVYLLSNTNAIHYEIFSAMYKHETGDDFNALFHKAYYSHLMKLSKPDPAAYLAITLQNNLEPAETLFVDDTFKNIEGALAVGMQTHYLEKGLYIENTLPALLANAKE